MLSSAEYIQKSMEYNLFWVRIMKEHAIFLESSMPPPLAQAAQQAEYYKQQFAVLLAETIRHSGGLVSASALRSGQYYTRFTEAAEQAVQQLTGLGTDSYLTQMAYDIAPLTAFEMTADIEQSIDRLNSYILTTVTAFASFKSDLLESRSACRSFTLVYTADISHMLREAQRYAGILTGFLNREAPSDRDDAGFWNSNMADHAKTMRGLFDPTETAFIGEADRYARAFGALATVPHVTSAHAETMDIGEFKATVTQGMLSCKVRSIMNPLFTDHLLREASHYLWLMNTRQ